MIVQLNRMLSPVVDLLYPPACAFCSTELTAEDNEQALCSTCRSDFCSDDRAACVNCGHPVGPFVPSEDGCIHCRRRHFRFQQLVRLGVYDNELRHACIRGKSPGSETLSAAMSVMLCRQHAAQLATFGLDIVVPVPQHWMHRITRPHHQANTIGEMIASELSLPFYQHGIKKLRRTKDQSSLAKAQRLQNLSKAFRVADRSAIAGKTVLLVDDISTTGTTANECARALRVGGAKKVFVAVIAVVEAAQ
jgi:ComF family protein